MAELNGAQPAMLGGYPTALQLLAEEQRAGRLRLHPVIINSGGEYLSPEVRAEVEAALSNSYACSEAGTIAHDCGHGWMHVSADWQILEPVDEHGQPVPRGQLSHSSFLTYLGNRVQPVIRYELGERVLVKPEPCACGSPLPAIRVEGRTDDILTLGGVRILPLALTAGMKQTPGIHRFQLRHTGPSTLEVRLDPRTPESWEGAKQRSTEFLRRQAVAGSELRLAAEEPQPNSRSGKFRHIIRTQFSVDSRPDA